MPRIDRQNDPCPYNAVTQVIKVLGGRWKLLVVQLLLQEGPLRYAELYKRLPNITEKMLSQVLGDLRKDDLLLREERKTKAPKIVVYQLTPLGLAAAPLLEQMAAYGALLVGPTE